MTDNRLDFEDISRLLPDRKRLLPDVSGKWVLGEWSGSLMSIGAGAPGEGGLGRVGSEVNVFVWARRSAG